MTGVSSLSHHHEHTSKCHQQLLRRCGEAPRRIHIRTFSGAGSSSAFGKANSGGVSDFGPIDSQASVKPTALCFDSQFDYSRDCCANCVTQSDGPTYHSYLGASRPRVAEVARRRPLTRLISRTRRLNFSRSLTPRISSECPPTSWRHHEVLHTCAT